MSKGLEALGIIKGTQQHLKLLSSGELKAFEIIEKELKEKEELEKAFNTLSMALETIFKYITIGNPFGNVHYIYLNDESEMIMPEDWEKIKEVLL